MKAALVAKRQTIAYSMGSKSGRKTEQETVVLLKYIKQWDANTANMALAVSIDRNPWDVAYGREARQNLCH